MSEATPMNNDTPRTSPTNPRGYPQHVQMHRLGCCAGWPKPCSYHEGYADAYELVPPLIAHIDQLTERAEKAEAKLRAAERVVEAARLATRLSHSAPYQFPLALAQAIAVYDKEQAHD